MFFRTKKKAEDEAKEEAPPEAEKQEKPKKKRRIFRVFLYWFTVIFIWTTMTLLGAISYYALTLPDPSQAGLDKKPPNVTIIASNGDIIAKRGMRRQHIRLKEMPKHLVDAVLSIEDSRFYYHIGFDPYGMLRAIWVNYRTGQVVQGGSTITQQLAKNLFLSSQRTFARKAKEILAAFWLEMHLSKTEILELYLNRMYYGAGAYGIEAASYQYFEKSTKELTLSEASLLAGLLKAPSRYSPTRNRKASRNRTKLVLNRMRILGKISKKDVRTATQYPAKIRHQSKDQDFSYVVDWILEQIPGFVGETGKDLIVRTTINPRLQKLMQQGIANIMQKYSRRKRAGEAAAVMINKYGAIQALSGGRSHKVSPFNRAVRAKRQPGSAFKPFVFLAALESGYSTRSIVQDRPIRIGTWRPRNYAGYHRGPITVQHAMTKSVNSVAVRLFLKAGRGRVIQAARRLGISSEIHHKPSLALGTAEVSLLELTAAYVPFSNGGRGIVPYVIKSIEDINGKKLYRRIGKGPGRIISRRHVNAMNRMMNSVIVRGTGQAAYFRGQAMAGKTGTSQSFRDAWFLGYTPYYTMGVWVGNDDNTNMRSVTGGSIPAVIWNYVMRNAHRRLPPRSLPGVYLR